MIPSSIKLISRLKNSLFSIVRMISAVSLINLREVEIKPILSRDQDHQPLK